MARIDNEGGGPRGRRVAVVCISSALMVVGAGLMGGCEKDEFADAPRASAPEKAKAAGPRRRQRGRPGPQAGGRLPADHPPIKSGSGQPSRSAGQNRGGPNRGGASSLPIEWSAPEAWTSVQPASRMRRAQYRVPGPDGAEPATLAVFYFRGGGGGVQKNIDRWSKQFDTSGGHEAKVEQRTVNGMTVHVVDIAGTFQAGRGMGSGQARPNYRMLAAIAETQAHPVFFKMVGPEETLGANTEEFDRFVASFEPGS